MWIVLVVFELIVYLPYLKQVVDLRERFSGMKIKVSN